MTVDSNYIIISIAVLANVLGSGFVSKIAMASIVEKMRETFVTKEAASLAYLTKDDAQKEYATLDEVGRIWGQITDHVIEPLNQITKRLDDLFLMLARRGHEQADGSR